MRPTNPAEPQLPDASPGPGSPTIGVTAATASLQKKTQNQQKTHSTQPPQLPDDLTRQPLQASSEPPGFRPRSGPQLGLHQLVHCPSLSLSLPLPLSTSPSSSPQPLPFFSVFMTFTHFLFNEKKTNCLVAYIFSEEFWGIFMAKEPLRNGQRKQWGVSPP